MEGAFLHGARVLSDKRRGGSDEWWNRFDLVKAYVEKTGSFHGLKKDLRSWQDNVMATWREGRLKNSQIEALRSINFPFLGLDRNKPTMAKGTKLDAILCLKQAFDAGKPLSEKEIATLTKSLNDYRSAYTGGRLSETSAKKLGIV